MSDGIAMLFWAGLAGLVFLVAAGAVEWVLSRPSRAWVRRLRDLERARSDWRSRVVAGQTVWRDGK